MIQILATKYRRRVAFTLFIFFDLFFFLSAAATGPMPGRRVHTETWVAPIPAVRMAEVGKERKVSAPLHTVAVKKAAIGGPNQPEMASFKPADMKNMVNLFTGDFSYNIPLLDVGGYPVNLFYNGEVGPEQEASWVGLGWNINPGNINRNMRGVPDDFDGTEKLEQHQNMKPNVTVGVGLEADAEAIGMKLPFKLSLSTGVSFNNYLGIALDLGVKGGIEFKAGEKAGSEKNPPLTLGLDLGLDLNSRSGLTISPSASLTGNAFLANRTFIMGATASTSYNSRVGMRSLQISDQLYISKVTEKVKHEEGFDLITHPKGHYSANLFGTSISFARPSYTPSMRMPLANSTEAGHFQLGGGIFGAYASAEVEVYKQTSKVDPSKVIQYKPMVGYMYADKANSNANAVVDFTRLNDREVTANTPIVSAPQYTFDVFSIQGEGSGGAIRAYRSDPGFVRDNLTKSTDNNTAVGVDVGPAGHYGGNFNMISTPSTFGEWTSNNNLLTNIEFRARMSNLPWEHVYFRNPGETSVLDNGEYDGIGGTNLVRFRLVQNARNPGINAALDYFNPTGGLISSNNPISRKSTTAARKKRTQVVDFMTAAEADSYGLDKTIKNYNYQTFLDPTSNTLKYTEIPRYTLPADGYRLRNHISEIHVTETDGRRYVYGIPVYNKVQKDFTFTALQSKTVDPYTAEEVGYGSNELNPATNPAITDDGQKMDGFAQITTTPGYAHSFLLSALLSPDYVDVTGDGITDDDLGNAVKFNYSMIMGTDGKPDYHKWRSPMTAGMATFNAGNLTNVKDNKGLISYGERESWYLHSIVSKTMIAIFTLTDRSDLGSVVDSTGAQDGGNHSAKRLTKIELFSKADLKKNGYGSGSNNAKPIKTVNFSYDYSLCPGTRDNFNGGGKLTLTGIYYTYNGQNSRSNKDRYVFTYGGAADNPPYEINGSDRWGTYKPKAINPAGMRNADFPYTPQQVPATGGGTAYARTTLGLNAGAWSLKEITLPSGGKIDVTYETDDYAYVQDRRAMEMMSIAGFGNTADASGNELYPVFPGETNPDKLENLYLFIHVPRPCSATDVQNIYLDGVSQLAVKMLVNMPSGPEYVTSYASFDSYGVSSHDPNTIWVKLKPVNGKSPLSLSALEFLREQLPGQAFPGYDVSQSSGLAAIGDALGGMVDAVSGAFSDPVKHFRSKGMARSVQLDHSFVRLNDPVGYKLGGGQRVKSITLSDNWKAMSVTKDVPTGTYDSKYEQDYRYETTKNFHGTIRTISSGVASYEPAMGGEENPFQEMLQVQDKVPLGPVSYGSIELPGLESFFPAPVVGYSKVTVTSVSQNVPTARSGIGRQVTQFYTAKDYPVSYSHTGLDGTADLQEHDASTFAFFSKYAFDSRAISQGFLVATNDMHGKLRSQSSYAENDTTLRVNYTENFYRNTGVNGMAETFDFVSSANGGAINSGNLGIDVELMTDTREFKVSSTSEEVQAQVDLFPVYFPFWIPFIWPVKGNSDNIYRAVTATKVITYHSVLDSVLVIDKGSKVGTKNLLYDAETGEVIVTRTNNEFDKPIYSTKYPAWWAYSGMGPAYRNTEVMLSGVNISDGKLVGATFDQSLLESGDELFSSQPTLQNSTCPPSSPPTTRRVWVMDKNKNNAPFPRSRPDFIFIDSLGQPYTSTPVADLHIIRSGKRNMLDATVATVTSMTSPIYENSGTRKLSLDRTSAVLNAAAVEFGEKWQADKAVIGNFITVNDPNTCTTSEVSSCTGHIEKSINPYRKGLLGNFRVSRTLTFYDNRKEINPANPTHISRDGTLDNFDLYWYFDASGAFIPRTPMGSWIEAERATRFNLRGLQLETVNANNIYTSAQYGYRRSLPLAITNNSPVYQSVYEGFEDNGFDQGLDNDKVVNCSYNNMVDWLGMPNTTLVNTETTTFRAHTGKYVLAVGTGKTASVGIPIVTSDNTNFNLAFGSNTTKVLHDPGINSVFTPEYGDANHTWVSQPQPPTISTPTSQQTVVSTFVSTFINLQNPDALGIQTSPTEGAYSWDGWMNITAAGQYTFQADVTNVTIFQGVTDEYIGYITMEIFGEDDDVNALSSTSLPFVIENTGAQAQGQSKMGTPVTLKLCPGHYHVKCHGSSWASPATGSGDVGGGGAGSVDAYYNFTTSYNGPFYKNLNMVDGCTTTTPIPGDATMLNPTFSMKVGQKMVLSAWVRQGQPAVTGEFNPGDTYKDNSIVVNDGSNNLPDFKPTGPIVDGWQRCEAVFTPASGTATISFVNNSSSLPLYLDDIRIHPFNAEMKSYVYDPVNLRLIAELDNNNYATFYEYDEEGTLIRTKAETQRGIKTIKESRSAKQRLSLTQ